MIISLKLKLLIWMICFVDMINIILMSIFLTKTRLKEKLNLNIFIFYYLLTLNIVLYKRNRKIYNLIFINF